MHTLKWCLLIKGIKDLRLYGRRKLFGKRFNSKREDEFKKIVFENFPKEFMIDREWSQRLIEIQREEYLKEGVLEEKIIVDTQDHTRIYKNK